MVVGSTTGIGFRAASNLHGTSVRVMMGQYGISSHQPIDGDHAMGEKHTTTGTRCVHLDGHDDLEILVLKFRIRMDRNPTTHA